MDDVEAAGPVSMPDASGTTHTRVRGTRARPLDRILQAPRAPLVALTGLGAAIVALAAAAVLLPDLAYYPFVWKYYYGPIVADAAGAPVTRGGVTAYSGYNPVNMSTWGVVLGVALWNVHAYLEKQRMSLTRPLAFALLPTIAAGGTLRGLIDADWVPEPWAYAFITPNIYFVMFAWTLVFLLVGVELERRGALRVAGRALKHWHVVAAGGVLAFAITLSGVAWFIAHPPTGEILWRVIPEIFGYSAVLTALLVGVAWLARLQFARDPLYVLILYGQVVDGMQNYLGLTQGYASKLMGTNFLAHWLGDPGLLVGKVVIMVPMLAYVKAKVEPDPETGQNTLMLLLIAILALGLAMGFHGGVGMLLGV